MGRKGKDGGATAPPDFASEQEAATARSISQGRVAMSELRLGFLDRGSAKAQSFGREDFGEKSRDPYQKWARDDSSTWVRRS